MGLSTLELLKVLITLNGMNNRDHSTAVWGLATQTVLIG